MYLLSGLGERGPPCLPPWRAPFNSYKISHPSWKVIARYMAISLATRQMHAILHRKWVFKQFPNEFQDRAVEGEEERTVFWYAACSDHVSYRVAHIFQPIHGREMLSKRQFFTKHNICSPSLLLLEEITFRVLFFFAAL